MILKVFRTIKYKNKKLNTNINPRVRKGDNVKVIRGDHKGKIGIVKKRAYDSVLIEGVFVVGKPDKRFAQQQDPASDKSEVNKYSKIKLTNVIHVDENGSAVKPKFRIFDINGIHRKKLSNQNNQVIDNFEEKVQIRRMEREKLEQEKRMQEEAKRKEAEEKEKEMAQGGVEIENAKEEVESKATQSSDSEPTK